ncbi:gamma-glutamyl hydrolase isoform X1 [Drosophila serrata]|uniref:gamma-glutamyl hydrolase isoform X1 n=1 Tax=Drosophila serrata TaxID=7274 RepID=UPI000A1D18DC|nr:gamma-glutamyl hydrolase isoform X1 [Drosophila serrata]XP_020816830.1 gamma-glutamyl hydrolase isoform X1 [Drosophila serrata]
MSEGACASGPPPPLGHTPTIGVMCIDIATKLQKHFGEEYHSYLAASYIKYLEASGAHVAPVWIGRDRAYYKGIMDQINGILLPGGAVFFEEAEMKSNPKLTNDCVRSAEHIYQLAMERNKLAKKENDAGGYFPLWGTCLGFQLLLIHAAETPKIRTDCMHIQQAMPLRLSEDYLKSQLLQDLPTYAAEQMERVPFASHQHQYCVTEQSLESFGLANDWHTLGTQMDSSGVEFISLIEHRHFPFFGSQFHAERAAFEQLFAGKDLCHESHTPQGIELAQLIGARFVEVCRRNRNRFDSPDEKARHLINNWQPVFSGLYQDSKWLQCYLFKKEDDYPEKVVRNTESDKKET